MSRVAVALLVAVTALAGCGEDGGDEAAFCDEVAALREDDPFSDLEVATPAEMREAFDALAGGADRLAAAAPGDVEVQAERYRAAVDAVRDELAGAGYDPRRLDGRRYARAVEEYTAAAGSLDNAADARC
ncbi:MAG TPA: hypothetical protein VFU14_19600 [Acidimicrobiales bacterium]|nr:hypothetical protein [Acidimicrobiales bacterium]